MIAIIIINVDYGHNHHHCLAIDSSFNESTNMISKGEPLWKKKLPSGLSGPISLITD